MFRTLYSVIPVKELAEKMKSSVQSLRSMACQLGITQPRKYTVNEHYFDCIDTTEKAYWLGFLFADGSIGKRYKVGTPVNVRLEIDKRDAEHVTEFIKALGSDVPLSYRPNRNTVTAIICDPQLAGRVAQLIRPKETATPWLGLSEDLQIAFIRGVFDGDGCVTHCGATPRIEFLGNAAFCSLVESLSPIKFSRREYHSKNGWLFNLYATGVSKLRDFAFWLYGVDGPCLQRKLWRFGSFGIIPFIAGGALPNQISSTVPAGGDAPSTIDNRIRSLALGVEDILGIPDATNVSAAAFNIGSTGLSSINFQTAVNPSVSGVMARTGANLQYHDGTSSYSVTMSEKTQTLLNKTLSSPVISGTITGSGTYSSPQLSTPNLIGQLTGNLDFDGLHTLANNRPYSLSVSVNANNLNVQVLNVDGNALSASSSIPFVFRNATLTTGTPIVRIADSAMSITAPSGADFGFSSNQTSRIWVLGVDDGSSVVPGLFHSVDSASSNFTIRTPGGSRINTSAVGTGSDSAGSVFTVSALTNRPWEWLGWFEIQTGATQGQWSNAPTTVHIHYPWEYKPGDLIQSVCKQVSTSTTGSTAFPDDSSVPDQTEGDPYMSQHITKTSAVNMQVIEIQGHISNDSRTDPSGGLYKQGVSASLAAVSASSINSTSEPGPLYIHHTMVGDSATSTTYIFRAGFGGAGTTTFNPLFGGRSNSYLEIREYMV